MQRWRVILPLALAASCTQSTEMIDPTRADLREFCVEEESLVCEACSAERCEAHPSLLCSLYDVDWPCDPVPNQSQADACLRALRADPCGDLYPSECSFLTCRGTGERP